MFVPGIMASRVLVAGGTPQLQRMDFEDADPDSYLPFFDWQNSVGQFDLFQQFLVLDNGAKSNTPQEGLNYLRVGQQYSYGGNSQQIRTIRFSIPGGASGSPQLSIWYRPFYATNDTLRIILDQYPDGTYIGSDGTDTMAERVGAAALTRDYTWTNVTSPLVAGKFYEIVLEYFFRTTNPNFPSDQRPTGGGVVGASNNLGESLLIDNIEVSYDL